MLIILDRDGVINYDSHEYIKSPDEWIEIPGSIEAIAKLKQQGHQVVVATNQSGIARGFYTHEILEQIHNKMKQALAQFNAKFDGIFYCPHHPDDACVCRKPEPGLLVSIGETFGADLTQAAMVGDSWRDLQAGMAVGAKPVLVRTGNGEITITEQADNLKNITIIDSLAQVAQCF